MRRLRLLGAGLTVAAVAVALAHPGAAKATQYNEWQTAAGLCMGVAGGNMTAGTAIITWTCDDSFNQFWAMDPNSGASGTFLLRNEANPSECLSVVSKSTAIGAQLVIWPCKAVADNQDQRWRRGGQFAVPIYNFNSGWQVLGSGPQGSAVVQGDNRMPFTWQEGKVVRD